MTGQAPDRPPVTDATVRDEPPPRTGYAARAGIVAVSAAMLGSALGWRNSLGAWARARLEWLTAAHALWLGLGLALAALSLWALSTRVSTSKKTPGLRALAPATPPAVAWLPLVIALSASFAIVLSAETAIPRVLGDELIYSGVAKGLAVQGDFLLRGERHLSHSLLYPLLISPAYSLAPNGASAHSAVQALNALMMSLTALPAWALARRVVPPRWALAVALSSVAGSWLGFSAWVMTESAFYPAVTAFALLLVATLERPTLTRQGAVVVAVGAIVAIRAQALVLPLGVLLAVLLFGLTAGSLRRTLRSLAPLVAVMTTILAAGSLALWLGLASNVTSYSVVFDGTITAGALLRWSAWNLAVLALASGLVAAVALPGAAAEMLRRQAPVGDRAVGAVIVAQSIAITASVAVLSASSFGLGRLQERTIFYLAPLLLTGMAVWLHRGLRARRPWAAAAGAIGVLAIVAWLPDTIPGGTTVASLLAAIHSVPLGLSAALAVAVLGIIATFLPGSAIWPVLGAGLVAAAVLATDQTGWNSPISQAQSSRLAWIDRALPAGARAALVHLATVPPAGDRCASAAVGDQQELMLLSEFLNTRVTYAGYVFDPYRVPVAGSKAARVDLSALRPDNFPHGASLTLWHVDKPARLDFQGPLQLTPRPDGQPCS